MGEQCQRELQVRDDAFPAPFYNTCLPTVQGVSPGWTDVYTSDLEGQQFSLAGLADGRYALVIRTNYVGSLLETDYTDNVVEATLEVSNGMTEVSIVERQWPTLDDDGGDGGDDDKCKKVKDKKVKDKKS